MTERNVHGGDLEPCGTDPVTGFYRDGTCTCGPEDVGLHAVCAVMTAEFLAHQQAVGNDLLRPRPESASPGCGPVTAGAWWPSAGGRPTRTVPPAGRARRHHERALEVLPLEWLDEHAVDVPDDPRQLG